MAIFHCKPYNTLLNCVNYQLFDNFFINKTDVHFSLYVFVLCEFGLSNKFSQFWWSSEKPDSKGLDILKT